MKLAWVYGCLPPLDWDEDIEREANGAQLALWNELVEIERTRRRGQEAIWRRDPPHAAILDRLAAIEARLAAIPRRRASEPERAERTALFAEQRTLWSEAKPLRAEALKPPIEAIYVTAMPFVSDLSATLAVLQLVSLIGAKTSARAGPEFVALNEARYMAITAARRASGLWWGNYNAVTSAFDVALGRLGPGEMVQLHEPDYDARLTNQIQGGISAENWLSFGHAQAWLSPMPPHSALLSRGAGRKGRLRLLTITAWSRARQRRTVSLPLVWHRSFPPDAVIMQIIVQRRAILHDARGAQRQNCRWQAIFVLDVDGPLEYRDRKSRLVTMMPVLQDTACGIDIGWRQMPSGLRIAAVAGSDGIAEEVLLPTAWLTRRAALERLDACDDHRRAAKHHGLDELLAERREIYRCAAARIARRWRVVAIDAAIKPLARRKRVEEGTELPPIVRRLRHWAAPALLAQEIERAVKVRGGTVLWAKGASTITCHRCGHVNRGIPEGWRADLQWRCQGCRHLWDQDHNAARVLLAAALDSSAMPSVTLESKQNKGLRTARLTRRRSARKLPDKPLESEEELVED